MDGSITVDELPALWSKKMKEYLGRHEEGRRAWGEAWGGEKGVGGGIKVDLVAVRPDLPNCHRPGRS
jgi:hypothetical protein